MKQAMIIVNPSSGKANALEYVNSVSEVLEAAGYRVKVEETAEPLDATRYCIAACEGRYETVVSIGGDGTLHETINGLVDREHRPRLGVVPLGTVNDFARALRIPLDPDEAIAALNSPHTRRVDLGRLNEELFANVVAAGTLPESLAQVTSEEKSRLGVFAYLKEGVKELVGSHAQPMTIRYNDQVWEGECPLFIAALTNSVGGFERLAPGAEVDDGLLHGYIFKDLSLFTTMTASLSLLLGSLEEHKDVIAFTSDYVEIDSPSALRTNVDGETGPPLPIRLRVLPRHIEVIVPAAAEEA
ncbi:diacylglycerol kinase family lipid kinase [Paenibacillus sp. IB182496]|uniref:Diacylglycerol kinase family lipid kinase n=1 Tax=Paenibacillus sabuli TaxID=2772509 RepID=A0A927BZ96_9BACL|nr:diacylglycerol kinase family protein [Paenibacillus sabuli]MBD2848480.1 diacylglycerol kinase family lipid kinase [Paenibacillus sabuli]